MQTSFNQTTSLPLTSFQYISGNPLNGFVEGCSAFLSALCETLLMGDSHLRAIHVNIQNLPITLKKKIINGERTGKEDGGEDLRKKTLYKGNSTCHPIT